MSSRLAIFSNTGFGSLLSHSSVFASFSCFFTGFASGAVGYDRALRSAARAAWRADTATCALAIFEAECAREKADREPLYVDAWKMARLADKIGEKTARRAALCVFLIIFTGSLLFCPDCGTLLDLPKGDEETVKCEQCGHLEPASCKSS